MYSEKAKPDGYTDCFLINTNTATSNGYLNVNMWVRKNATSKPGYFIFLNKLHTSANMLAFTQEKANFKLVLFEQPCVYIQGM